MNRTVLIAFAGLLDAVAGDPEGFPHPVRSMGFVISRGERILRRYHRGARFELVAGTTLTLIVVGVTYGVTKGALAGAKRCCSLLGDALELGLAWTCLASRDLYVEADAVLHACGAEDLTQARHRLGRIVGRDTTRLDRSEISRAVIETVAESLSDGVIAPLFYLTLGGVPLAMAYKAVNTLDSMIGYADARYLYFGRCAARLDDVANLIPSRLTALGIAACAAALPDLDGGSALRIWVRDGGKHRSPNAGQPESAISGALRARLGGANVYAGEHIETPRMGAEFPAAEVRHARSSMKILVGVTLLGVAAGMLASLSRRRTV